VLRPALDAEDQERIGFPPLARAPVERLVNIGEFQELRLRQFGLPAECLRGIDPQQEAASYLRNVHWRSSVLSFVVSRNPPRLLPPAGLKNAQGFLT